MSNQKIEERSVQDLADLVADSLDADVIYFTGPILRHHDRELIEDCIKRRRRKNVLFILVTVGGDADSAYRIARCLQEKYDYFYFYVPGYCKSAGTLVATGAHELIMSDHGELGPLDVQMSKKDELWEMESGLTVMDTLTALQKKALGTFEEFLLSIKAGSQGSITLKTATEVATTMTTGLFAPLYSQVDPLHVGEAGRAMSIAAFYGTRLLNKGNNIEPDALNAIISDYPSHGFVIDRGEAEYLFNTVREPTEIEVLLTEKLGDRARWPITVDRHRQSHLFLSTELSADKVNHINETKESSNETQNKHAERAGSGNDAEKTREKLVADNGGNGK